MKSAQRVSQSGNSAWTLQKQMYGLLVPCYLQLMSPGAAIMRRHQGFGLPWRKSNQTKSNVPTEQILWWFMRHWAVASRVERASHICVTRCFLWPAGRVGEALRRHRGAAVEGGGSQGKRATKQRKTETTVTAGCLWHFISQFPACLFEQRRPR